MARTLAILALLLLCGCLRVGPGEDLHLVCEEKSAAPRKAYDLGFLVARTRIEGEEAPTEADRLGMLEAARQHVITVGGRSHVGVDSWLSPRPEGGWTFQAVGVHETGPSDEYHVLLADEGGWVGFARSPIPHVEAPRTVRDPAWEAVNETPGVASGEPVWASWDPEFPSCVRLRYEPEGGGPVEVVVNLPQGRVVHFDDA